MFLLLLWRCLYILQFQNFYTQHGRIVPEYQSWLNNGGMQDTQKLPLKPDSSRLFLWYVGNDHQHHYKQLYSTQIFIRSEFALDTCFQCIRLSPAVRHPKCGCKWMSCCTVSYYVTLWKQRRFNNIINVTPLSFFNLINVTFLYNTFVYKLKIICVLFHIY